MCDSELVDVEQPSEDLVADDLDIHVGQPLLVVLLDEAEQVAFVVCHHDVEVLSALLEG